MDVCYAWAGSPLGPLLLVATPAGLIRVSFADGDAAAALAAPIRLGGRAVEDPAALAEARTQLQEYFDGARTAFDLPLDLSLVGGFTRRVLEAAAAIPHGQVRTYAEVAAAAGNPRAARAAGNALGANPLPVVVPCHRVVRTGGALGGYTAGLDRKGFLLRLEGRPAA